MPTNACDGGNAMSYPATWARDHGITDIDNLAVSYSSVADWLPAARRGREDGRFYDRLRSATAADPNVLFLTIGANPMAAKVMYVVGDDKAIDCVDSDDVRSCVSDLLEELQLQQGFERLYTQILASTTKTRVIVQEYPGFRSPLRHGDASLLLSLLNQCIEAAVRAVRLERPSLGRRITVVRAPAGFPEHALSDPTAMLMPPIDSIWDARRNRFVDLWVTNNDGGTHLNARGMREIAGALDRQIWGRLPDATIAVEPASPVDGESAKLNATIDTGGFDTAYRVEYGTAPGANDRATPSVWAGRQPGALPWSVVVDGLEPDTTYYYRFVVTQQVGDTVKVTRSAPASFTTAAGAIPAAQLVDTTIEANGREDVGYSVEYGTTSAYGKTTPRRYIGQPSGRTSLTEVLTHLEPGATYHRRFVITRQQGDRVVVERTPDVTFTIAGRT